MRDFSLDVSEVEFDTAVIALSRRVPVLVDFWAPWCGPCRTLKPMLEKLATEYGGRFVLAKINSDEAQTVAARYAVRSIPAVKLFVNGNVVDEFAGALPEGQVRAFLDRHLPDEAERLRLSAAGIADPLQRAERLRQAASMSGGRQSIILELVGALLDARLVEDAAAGLETIAEPDRDEAWRSLKARLDLIVGAEATDESALVARIGADAKDFEARFALAAALAGRGEWGAAFEQLLEVVLRDRADARGKARDTLVEWFGICPDAKAVMNARRQLSMYLN